MKSLTWLRGSRRMTVTVIGLALSLVLAGVTLASSIQTPTVITPHTAGQITNIDILRLEIKNYYGTPGAATGGGPTAGWTLALNPDSNYAAEAASVAAEGSRWLASQAKSNAPSGMKAIVLDVDDTTLTTWNYELFSNWDYNPGTNAEFVGLTGTTFTGNLFPATPGMVAMVNQAADEGYAVFFITGRPDAQHAVTIANLVSDQAAGFADVTTVDHTLTGLSADGVDVDAGYPMPTPVDTGHGGFTDGLFTKPTINQTTNTYPAYLDKPEFCGPYIATRTSCPTIKYKSGTRAYLESLGYEIVADFGDQYSDLIGGFADKTFKMPNPNYYLP